MSSEPQNELFETGLNKIRHETKSRLASHGLYGIIRITGLDIEITAKGRSVHRSFEHEQIESCHLRVKGEVLAGIIAMIDELAATPP